MMRTLSHQQNTTYLGMGQDRDNKDKRAIQTGFKKGRFHWMEIGASPQSKAG
jgi:hypothetical protein